MIKTLRQSDHLLVVVEVESLDASNVQQFKAALEPVPWNEIRAAEVDMEKVKFIDSSGVGALLNLVKRLPNRTEQVTLLKPSASVVSVVELLRLTRVFALKA